MDSRHLPLVGVRVLEFCHAVMGPTCGLVLADMGAEVIKIEPAPGGDHTRRLKGFGSGYFTFFNRNKKALAVNAKTERGRQIIYGLIDTADVLIENFAPGTMDRLGFGFEAVSDRNPALIYCSLKGFLPGPYDKRPALDEVVQMMSGLAYMTGPPGRPLRAGASVVDIMGGICGAMGILVALRDRDRTGQGQLVQNGLFETAAFIMGQHMAYSAITHELVPPMPARVSAWAVYRVFDTQDDKPVFVGITSDKHWRNFCEVFGRNDLLADETLATNNDRIEARDWLLPELERLFAHMPQAEIARLCDAADIPFAPVTRPEDLFSDPHLNGGSGLLETTLPDGEKAKLPRLPVTVGEYAWGLRLEPPKIGEHTLGLLRAMGYQDEELRALLKAQVIEHTD
jgi:crotonobetainyl-CoA:carnitine CoA-transferase CaiB-like acyl-CoA transferase